MADQNNKNLQSQIDRLEQRVKELEQRLAEGETSKKLREEATKAETQKERENRNKAIDNIQFGEEWLNRIGIGLLLIGVVFLFKYSIDQGWLIPPIRSAIGLGIGALLFGSGLKMGAKDKPLKQILLGGGIAAFYITGFATYQLYSFMPGLVIWVFMVVVTLLALSLSLQQDEAILSIVGTLGALGTPFMLYSGGGSIPMLMLYLALVLAGTSVVYLFKGWQTLLWSFAMGGFVVLCVGVIDVISAHQVATATEKWSLQAGVTVWVMATWLLPIVREVLSSNDPHHWPDPGTVMDEELLNKNMVYRANSSIHLVVFLIPLFSLVLTHGIWNFSMPQAGMVSISLAVLGSMFFFPLKSQELTKLASTHAFLSLVMLTIGIFLLLEGSYLFTILAAETVALRYIARQTGDSKISVSSHILFGLIVYWMINMLVYSGAKEPFLINIESISQLAFITAGGLLIPMWLKKNNLRQVYQITSHVVFLFWLYQKFVILENGQAWVTVAWGIYAIAVLVLGFFRYSKRMRVVGMATIFIVVGKLFLVDLSQLQAIWRILLFTGFGAVFLILGYYSQSKWKDESKGNRT